MNQIEDILCTLRDEVRIRVDAIVALEKLFGKGRIEDGDREAAPLPDINNSQGETKPIKRGTKRGGRKPNADAKTRTEKPCNKCGKTLPLDKYSKNHTCSDGHEGTCIECKHARMRAHYAAKRAAAHPTAKGDRLEKTVDKAVQIPKIDPDPEDGLFYCPVTRCDAALRTRDAYEAHYRLKHM